MSIIFIILFGYFIDRGGKRITFLLFGNILFGLGLLLFILLPKYGFKGLYAIIGVIGVGFGYGCIPAVIWPSLPIILEKKYTSLAYGLESIAMHISFIFNPLICGMIYDNVSET